MLNILRRGYSHDSAESLLTVLSTILTALLGHPFFVVTDPTLATVTTARDALATDLAMPKGEARDQAIAADRAVAEELLELLADNLEKLANNDPVKLSTTGYQFVDIPTQTTEAPSSPKDVRLKPNGISGEVRVLFTPSDRAKSYQVQWTLDPMNGPWTDVDPVASSRGVVLKALPRAKDVWVRVRAIGPHNTMSGWSDQATILVG
jgi:hypothetical protein